MLAQIAIVALLAAAPALVHAAPTTDKTTSLKNAGVKVKVSSIINNIKIGKHAKHSEKKHRKALKIDTALAAARKQHKQRKQSERLRAAALSAGFISPYSPYSAGYAPPSPYGFPRPYSPSTYGYQPPTAPYSAPITPAYNQIFRRDTILSPRSPAPELSPRALETPPTPLEDLSVLSRARIGLPGPGGPVLPEAYMRKGSHYRKPKAVHKNYGNDLQSLERLLEAAESVVNGLEEQMNKPKTLFPELESAKRRMKRVHHSKMGATAKLAAVNPATPGPVPAPAKSG